MEAYYILGFVLGTGNTMFISTQKLLLTVFKSGKEDRFISRIHDQGLSEDKYSIMTSRKLSPDLVKGVGDY